MAFLPRCSTTFEAIASFQTHGACVLANDAGYSLDEDASASMLAWFDECTVYMQKHQPPRKSRHHAATEDKYQRFSVNDKGNQKYAAWQKVAANVWNPRGGLACLVAQMMNNCRLDLLKVTQWGGDTVLANCKEGQELHSDDSEQSRAWLSKEGKEEKCEWIVASWALRPITDDEGPLYIVGKKGMEKAPFESPPKCLVNVELTDKLLELEGGGKVLLKKGEIILRDPRVWHAGTPNLSQQDRHLPAAIFSCAPLQQSSQL